MARSPLVAILVLSLVVCLPAMACPVAASGDGFTDLVWNPTIQGENLALRFSLESNATARCRVFANATGLVQSPGPVLLYRTESALVDRWEVTAESSFAESYARVAAGPLEAVATSPLSAFPRRYSAGNFGDHIRVDPGDPVRITVAARDLAPLPPGEHVFHEVGNGSLLLSLRCDATVRMIDLEGSGEASLFDPASMEEGASAHVGASLPPTGATLAGAFQRDIPSPLGLLLLRYGGDLLTLRLGGGVLQVTTPSEAETIVVTPSNFLVGTTLNFRAYEAAGGVYELQATFLSVVHSATFAGAILGFEPKTSLDELAA